MENSVVVSNYTAMDCILCNEWKYILNMCKKIKKCGANVVLIQKSILRDAYNKLSLHFLVKMGIIVITDVDHINVKFVCCTLGCTPIPHVNFLSPEKLRSAECIGDVILPILDWGTRLSSLWKWQIPAGP
jgi:T-complex protein 1 subunit delta